MSTLSSNTDNLNNILTTINNLPAPGITEETDPTVPAWAKEPTKPTYTAEEVGAATEDYVDAAIQAVEEKIPVVNYPVTSVNNKTGAVSLTATDVGALPNTTTIITAQQVGDAIDAKIVDKADKSDVPTNIMDGRDGSVRTTGAKVEDDEYTLGVYSFAEGKNTQASGSYSHAEGGYTTASGIASHAEGYNTIASGMNSHAEGINTIASGYGSHAEGEFTKASGDYSHAGGYYTIASEKYNYTIGKYNTEAPAYKVDNGSLETTFENSTLYTISLVTPTLNQTTGLWESDNTTQVLGSELKIGDIIFQESKSAYKQLTSLKNSTDTNRTFRDNRYTITPATFYAFTVGNGTSNTNRSNAHTLDWNGNAWFAGEIKVGGTGQDDTAAKSLMTEDNVNDAIDAKINTLKAADVDAIEYIQKEIIMPFSRAWMESYYIGDKFIIAPFNFNKIIYSTDGINWIETNMPSTARWHAFAYGDGKFVAITGDSNKAAYSVDGINWTETTLPFDKGGESIAYGDGKFVTIMNSSNKAIYSTDGVNWIEATMPFSATRWRIVYGNGKFVTVNYGSNKAAYSVDGINWTETTLPNVPTSQWIQIIYAQDKFVAINQETYFAAYSTDGINWIQANLPFSANWGSITYGNGMFIIGALKDTDQVVTSSDGINWNTTTMPFSANWRQIVYGNNKFIAIINNSTEAAYSIDGITWKTEYTGFLQNNEEIDVATKQYADEQFNYINDSVEALAERIENSKDFYVNLTPYETTEEGIIICTTNKSLEEMYLAFSQEKSMYAKISIDDSNTFVIPLASFMDEMFLFTIMADSVVAAIVGDGIGQFMIMNLPTQDDIDALHSKIDNINIPVTSVNNKTGAVKLTASDIGALPNTTAIPNNLSNGIGEGSISQSSEARGKNSFSQSASQFTYIYLSQDINNNKTYTYSDPNGNEKVQVGDIIIAGNKSSSVETIVNSSTFTTKNTLSIDGTVNANIVRGATLGENSHSEGEITNAIGKNSHSEGLGTIALGDNQHVAGKYNLANPEYAYILGNGSDSARSNAHTLNWNGTAWFANSVKVGGTGQDDTAAKNLATEEYVEEAIDLHVADKTNPHDVTAFQSGAMEFINKNLNIPITSLGDITYGLDKFVAVDYGRNEASYSYDGITWYETTLPYSEFWKTVVYGYKMFIALAESTKNIAYSYDGIIWQGMSALPVSSSWKSVIYTRGKYMAIASNSSKAYYSSDGFTWNDVTLPYSRNWQSMASDDYSKYVIIAKGSTTTAYSSDGINWSSGSMPSAANWIDVCCGADKFVAIANGSSTGAYSSDGINWTSMNMPRSTTWTSIHYSSKTNLFIATSESNYAAYSSDGINWNEITMPSTRLSTIVYNKELGTYIASSGGSSTAYSVDGINWKKNVSGIFQNGQDITDTIRLLLANSN